MPEREQPIQPPISQIEGENSNGDDVPVLTIRKLEDIETIEDPDYAEVIHITESGLATVPSLEKLKESFPNLTTITAAPRITQQISNPAKRFLGDNNIKVRPAYVKKYMDPEMIPDDTAIINSPDQINKIENPIDINRLHLSKQEAVSTEAINIFIDTFPNLKTIEISPSTLLKLSKTAQEILDDAGIQIETERLDTGIDYDSVPSRNLDEKRQVYKDMLTSSDKGGEKQIYLLLEEYGFEAVNFLKMYLEDDLSITEIAQRAGLRFSYVDKEVRALLHLIGYPSNSSEVLSRSRKLLAQLKKEAEAEAWQGYYQVENEHPPETLTGRYWPKWQQIMKARQDNPERWTELEEQKPDNFRAMVHFYQIDERRGTKVEMKDIAESENVSPQGISWRIKVAINYLTESEESEILKKKPPLGIGDEV